MVHIFQIKFQQDVCLFQGTRSEVSSMGPHSPLAGHSRMERTLDFVQRRFWWPEDVKGCRFFCAGLPSLRSAEVY